MGSQAIGTTVHHDRDPGRRPEPGGHRRAGRTGWSAFILTSLVVLSLTAVPTAASAAGHGSGGAAAGTTAPHAPAPSIYMSPDPMIAIGAGEVHGLVGVLGPPSWANRKVKISSPELRASCAALSYETLEGGSTQTPVTGATLTVTLDGDGDGDVMVNGSGCTPGDSIYIAKLLHPSSSVDEARGTLDLLPATALSPIVVGYPYDEVETNGQDLYVAFNSFNGSSYVGDLEWSSPPLEASCLNWRIETNDGATVIVGTSADDQVSATSAADADGNAAYVFEGSGCSAGSDTVDVNQLSSPHDTISERYEFAAAPPTIERFSPHRGDPGTTVAVTGSYLSGASLSFNGTPAVIGSDTGTRIETTVPSGATSGTITVTTAGGTATTATSFTVT